MRDAVSQLAELAGERALFDEQIGRRVLELCASGLGPLDAAHLALAESVRCDALVTCDDRLRQRAARAGALVRVLNPLELVEELNRG